MTLHRSSSNEPLSKDDSIEVRPIVQVRAGQANACDDAIAVERALKIWLVCDGVTQVLVTTTMRTPGRDLHLAVGFCYAEGILTERAELLDFTRDMDSVCLRVTEEAMSRSRAAIRVNLTQSACGVCGREDPVGLGVPRLSRQASSLRISQQILWGLPRLLLSAQPTFHKTGGVHAAGLYTTRGELRASAEDVGRHNAVDKLVGCCWLEGLSPSEGVLMVSGRASYELVQKAARADIPLLAAVGAPSSLAIETAQRAGMTLIGFARDGAFNIYTGAERVFGWDEAGVEQGI